MLISLNPVCSLLEMFALSWFFQSTIQTQYLLVGFSRSLALARRPVWVSLSQVRGFLVPVL